LKDPPIILETERLVLRYQQPSDVAALAELRGHPEVTEHMGGPRERVFATTDRDNRDSVRLMWRVGMRTATNPDANARWPGVVGVIENPLL